MKNKNAETRAVRRVTRNKKILRMGASFFYNVSNIILKIPYLVGKKIGMEDLACNLLMPFSEAIEKDSNCYVTYNLFPKSAKDLNEWLPYKGREAEKYCIVIQGPILRKNNFTLETVRYYGRIFPGVQVIVSTWEDESLADIKKLKREKNCVVVLSKYPDCAGIGNVNYQTVSSLNGMKAALKLGKSYALKTRSDTRVTAVGIMDILYQLLCQYPLKSNVTGCQKQRLLLFNAQLFHPYHSSDIFFYGAVEDMIRFFGKKLNRDKSVENAANKMVGNKWTYRDMFESPYGENEILMKYFEEIKGSVACDLRQWWSVLGESVIALPISFLRPIWVKYDYNHEESNFFMTYRRKIMGGGGMDNTKVDFTMWLDMYNNEFKLNPDDWSYLIDCPMS